MAVDMAVELRGMGGGEKPRGGCGLSSLSWSNRDLVRDSTSGECWGGWKQRSSSSRSKSSCSEKVVLSSCLRDEEDGGGCLEDLGVQDDDVVVLRGVEVA